MKTQEKAQHTPTPWHLEQTAVYKAIRGKDGEHIGFLSIQEPQKEKGDAEFIVRAVNSHEALLQFAKEHHEVCSDCEGTGKIYNNADPTSGQWVYCPYYKAIEQAEARP